MFDCCINNMQCDVFIRQSLLILKLRYFNKIEINIITQIGPESV